MEDWVKHTRRIIWMIGQTEVELISSVCSRGCICCISSFPRLSCIAVGVDGRDVISPSEADSRLWQLPAGRRVRPSLFHHTRTRHPTTATTMQTNAKSAQQSAVKIYNAVYSSVQVRSSPNSPPSTIISQRDNLPQVYECMVRGIAVMRRRADSYVNATQILKVAGVEKGRRTKILEKEILPGKHEIVQGGYGKYQGTWYAPLFIKQNTSLTSALGFPSNEVKN